MMDSDSSMELVTSTTLFASLIAFTFYSKISSNKTKQLSDQSKKYNGSCHCGKVTFEVQAPKHLVAWDCNCSICYMKKNWHFVVPLANFHLLSGQNVLTEYKFNTMVAKHVFCSYCGVQAYYTPRSNPDGIAVTLACISQDEIESYEIRKFDGNNWEDFINDSGISAFSKEK